MAGKIGHHTPEKTRTYEGMIKTLGMEVMGARDPLDGPVRLDVDVQVGVPASWPRWKAAAALAGKIAPTGKPDGDNILKAVMDGLNGVIWVDDTQVVEFALCKRYSATPRLVAWINPLTEMQASQSKVKLAEAA